MLNREQIAELAERFPTVCLFFKIIRNKDFIFYIHISF